MPLDSRQIAAQGFLVPGSTPLLIAVQGLLPVRGGSTGGGHKTQRGRWSPYARHDDVFNLPLEERAQLPTLSGEELALLLEEASLSSAEALLASVVKSGVPEQVFLASIGVPRAHLVALFEAHGPQLAAEPATLLTLLTTSEPNYANARLRLALLLAAALLMWD